MSMKRGCQNHVSIACLTSYEPPTITANRIPHAFFCRNIKACASPDFSTFLSVTCKHVKAIFFHCFWPYKCNNCWCIKCTECLFTVRKLKFLKVRREGSVIDMNFIAPLTNTKTRNCRNSIPRPPGDWLAFWTCRNQVKEFALWCCWSLEQTL